MNNRKDPENKRGLKEYKKARAEKWRTKDCMVAAKEAYFFASERVRCEEEIKEYALKHRPQAKIEEYDKSIKHAKASQEKARKRFEKAYDDYKKARAESYEKYHIYLENTKNRP